MHSTGLCIPATVRRARRPMGQVTVPDSNRRWSTDMTTVWTSRDGWVAVMPVVDCGDRMILALEASKSQKALSLLAPVEHALEGVFGERRNVPADLELRTDHGPQYTGLDCEQLCWRWRLEHTYAPVGRPTGNAVVERLILTLKMRIPTISITCSKRSRSPVPTDLDHPFRTMPISPGEAGGGLRIPPFSVGR